MRFRIVLLSALAVGVIASPRPAISQEGAVMLEEIIVTARKREESVQDIPDRRQRLHRPTT